MEKLYIVGIGPGAPENMTERARGILEESELIVGYEKYNELLRETFPEKEYFATAMRQESERCLYALSAAAAGRKTALVCSGDSGVYGMASLTLELAERDGIDVSVEVVPGITAALSASALLGAPVSGDFAVVSLSDLLTPWAVIERRLSAAAAGDFVIALYNPGSKKRRNHLRDACRILLESRPADTLCAVAEQIGREGERVQILTLGRLKAWEADMFTTILVGNSSTRLLKTADGDRLVTPRGYPVGEKDGRKKAREEEKVKAMAAEVRLAAEVQKMEKMVNTGRQCERTAGIEWGSTVVETRSPDARRRILIFGGTTEGRLLAERACDLGIPVMVCVATKYGEKVMEKHPLLTVDSRGLEESQIEELLRSESFLSVMDATHPYAVEITDKVAEACRRTGQRYVRVLRKVEGDIENDFGLCRDDDVLFVSSVEEAADFLNNCEGRALITTGSKEIWKYARVRGAGERLLFRVLPSHEALDACRDAGFAGKNLICMQGPFSVQANRAMLEAFHADFLVTKISGRAGGFPEKVEAARMAQVTVVAILPPGERSGISVEDAFRRIESMAARAEAENAGKSAEQLSSPEIVIAGIGAGGAGMITVETASALRSADAIIGAPRLTEDLARIGELKGKKFFPEYRPEIIVEFIRASQSRTSQSRASQGGEENRSGRYVIAVSGDSGFFSGAKALGAALEEAGWRTKLLPGISSVSALSAAAGVSWQDAVCVSAHGRSLSIASEVRTHGKVFVLTGGNAAELMRTLTEFGLGQVRVFAGERISYGDERISEGTAEDFSEKSFDSLTSFLIINPDARSRVPCGLPDDVFERGAVPMTKREVRAVTMSRLSLREDSVVFDIGAGTGSVTVEAALTAYRGRVYAIEKNREAAALIRKNCRRFAADNVSVVEGSAPEALKGLPAPDAVFIGGSGGNLSSIIDMLQEISRQRNGNASKERNETQSGDAPGERNGQRNGNASGERNGLQNGEALGERNGLQDGKSLWAGDMSEDMPWKYGSSEKSESGGLRVVINAASLETVGEAFRLLERCGAENISAVQVSAARSKKAGKHHLMEGLNPVFVISADLV